MSDAIQSQSAKPGEPLWHARFLAMMPSIRRHAQISFAKSPAELRAELTQATIASALATYAKLVEHGKESVAYPSSLARYAVGQVRAGRRVGGSLNTREVLSEQAQRSKGFVVERLDSLDVRDNTWHEIVVEDRRAGPAETAACRLDFSEWLARLPDRRRKIALTLANGETTAAAAKRFRVTSARISQLRNWFRKSWLTFQGEAEAESPTRLAVA